MWWVRLLTGDEPLRSLYGFEQSRIAYGLEALVAFPNLVCEEFGAVADAIAWMRNTVDFANALHLASARPAKNFATFDSKLVKRAAAISGITPVAA